MTAGLDIFRNHFSAFPDQYILIGGMACDLLMSEQGLDFRRTRDVDMVLIVEALTTDFVRSFWDFIEKGQYSARQRSNGKPEFYRFVDPKTPAYPKMIEIFARPRCSIDMSGGGHLTPLHIDDDISSLSAILLNEAYYEFLLEGKTSAEAISVLDGAHLIPFKMKAWLDLTSKKAQGIHVNDRDIRKHRQDVFRLFSIINPNAKIETPLEVYRDIQTFLDNIRDLPFETESIGLSVSKEELIRVYKNMYVIKA